MNRSLLLLASFTSLLGLTFACGGLTTSDDPSSSRQSQVRGQADDDERGSSTSGSAATQESEPDCVYAGFGGGSSGGGGATFSCMVAHDYTCSTKDMRITCECTAPTGGSWGDGTGSCTCGDLTFPIDCSSACSGVPLSAYAQCGVPAPPPDPPSNGGSSGSTSSSSSSGGSSSSSGGS